MKNSTVRPIEWYELIDISGHMTPLKIETGSQVNLVTYSDFKRLNLSEDKLLKTPVTISSFS
ncbi:hypothetical protein NQ314_018138 [Rhamnusium bicolor]|uniref:Uncharacterized protein n=1 Tax=Rhamnusium bicolor TaxID=1586634 RepID=A0AAV8WRP3_9CUCU|nr:hypothetical protein NQ314_018138 [Rhamnusium bicolor]